MVKKLLSALLVVGSLTSFGQAGLLYNGGSGIVVNGSTISADSIRNDGYIFTDGGLVEALDVVNNDTIHQTNASLFGIYNDYLAGTGGQFFSIGASLVELHGDWNNSVGNFAQSEDGLFSFAGTDQDIAHSNDGEGDFFGTVELNGGGYKVSYFNMFCKDIIFNDGILVPNSLTDTLAVITDVPLTHGSDASHVQGALFLVVPETYLDTEVIVPVGYLDGGGTNVYAPLEMNDFTAGADTSLFVSAVTQGPLTTPQLNGELESLYDDHYWALFDYFPANHSPFTVKLYADQAAVGTTEDAWVVAESNDDVANSIFFSLGSSDFGAAAGGLPSYVTSNYDASQPYLAIGNRCNTAKLSVNAQLQGTSTPSNTYQGYLRDIYVDGLVVDGESSSEQMFTGYDIDPSTIDLVKIVLREGTNGGSVVDTTFGWLLSDNSIVDFKTATIPYLEFCPASSGVTIGNDYYVELQHRNHIPVITSETMRWNAQDAAPIGADVDFTSPATHHSLYGYYPNGAVAELIAGDVSEPNIYPGSADRVDATDNFLTIWRLNELPATGYSTRDANLDGNINISDYNIVAPNARAVRRAVMPY